MIDFLFIFLVVGTTSSKHARLWALGSLVMGCLVVAANDVAHFRYGAALPLVGCAFVYLHQAHGEMKRRVKAHIAADPTFYDYETDSDMEERGRRAYMQMRDWVHMHFMRLRGDI